MLSSIRSRRRFILALVKFLSRALTALNLEPSMATLATLKPSARRNAIEIAINIYLEQCRRMVAGPPFFQRLNPTKAKLIKIKTFNERVNRTNGIVLGHVVVKHGRETCALASVNPFHKA